VATERTAEPHTSSDAETQRLPLLVLRACCQVIDQVRTGLRAAGHTRLRPAHGFLVRRLCERGEMTVFEIAGYLGVTKQSALELVDDLTEWGYVARRRNPRDQRSRLISLTEQGRAVEQLVQALMAEIEEKWEAEVGRQALPTVRAALQAYLDTSDIEVALRPNW
jgi:DNA-binding MarR family transcriptional regulator